MTNEERHEAIQKKLEDEVIELQRRAIERELKEIKEEILSQYDVYNLDIYVEVRIGLAIARAIIERHLSNVE